MNEIDTLRIKKRNIDIEIKRLKEKLHDLESESKEIGKRIVSKIEMGNNPSGQFRTGMS